MNKKPKHRRRIDGSNIISIISVAMMLLVTGLTIMIGLSTRRAASLMRSNVGFVAVIEPTNGQASVDSMLQVLSKAPYSSSAVTRSADEVLNRWEEMMGPEELLDINPFLPEIEVTVHPAWARPDSLDKIAAQLESSPCINHVQTQADIAAGINHTVSSTILLLAIVGLILLAISVVLIANTVKLQLYAQRFIIHTQQYVGATPAYIVRPYFARAAASGFIAALIASAALAVVRLYAESIDPATAAFLSWTDMLLAAVAVTVIGVVLCAVTARLTALKYIHSSYDDIFN